MPAKKILTIDFDIIMYPCLQLYNQYVGGDSNCTSLWHYLKINKGLEPFINYDANILCKIAQIIKQQVNKDALLIVCQEHQEVLDILKSQEHYEDNTFNITNIDFHHDIWYRPEDKTTLTTLHTYNCSNWLGYLILNHKTEEVIWYKAYNSDLFHDNEYESNPFTNIYRLDELDNLSDETFDEIYFVLSPQWVPYEFHHLFNLIISLIRE